MFRRHNHTDRFQQGGMMKKDQGNIACILATFPKVEDVIEPESKKRILSQCVNCVKEIPKKVESMAGYQLCISLTTRLQNPSERKWLLLAIARELPRSAEFHLLNLEVLSQSVRAANAIEDPKLRKDELLDIIHNIPEKDDYEPLFIEAMSHAIKAADEINIPQHRVHALINLVDEIPRTQEYN